jgi:hypothetical protein
MSEELFRIVITAGVGIAVICIVVMTAAAVGLARSLSKVQKKVEGAMDRVEPILDSVKRITEANEQKVGLIADRGVEIALSAKLIAQNAQDITFQAREIAAVARDQAYVYADVGRDVAGRAKERLAQVDNAVDVTLDKVQHAGETVRTAAVRPMREARAMFAGVKAAVATLARGKVTNADRVTSDEEMFI